MNLTKKEKQIINIGLKKDFLIIDDFLDIYSDKNTAKSKMSRFIRLGIIEKFNGIIGKFKIVEEKKKELKKITMELFL